jgi:hypothetical protein
MSGWVNAGRLFRVCGGDHMGSPVRSPGERGFGQDSIKKAASKSGFFVHGELFIFHSLSSSPLSCFSLSLGWAFS